MTRAENTSRAKLRMRESKGEHSLHVVWLVTDSDNNIKKLGSIPEFSFEDQFPAFYSKLCPYERTYLLLTFFFIPDRRFRFLRFLWTPLVAPSLSRYLAFGYERRAVRNEIRHLQFSSAHTLTNAVADSLFSSRGEPMPGSERLIHDRYQTMLHGLTS
jgi:hypothetical protein